MGQSISTGLVQADLTANINTTPAIPSTEQTIVQGYESVTTSDSTLYTVPASKVFYLFALVVSEESKNVDFGVDNLTIGSGRFLNIETGAAEFTRAIISPIPINKLTAGQVLLSRSSAGTYCSFWGVLVDA